MLLKAPSQGLLVLEHIICKHFLIIYHVYNTQIRPTEKQWLKQPRGANVYYFRNQTLEFPELPPAKWK